MKKLYVFVFFVFNPIIFLSAQDQKAADIFIPNKSAKLNRLQLSSNQPQLQMSSSNSVLFDNGPLVNSPGTGSGGADESILQSSLLGLNILGFGHQVSYGNWVADDFTINDPEGWDITKFLFYAYQTGSSTTSTITAVHIIIYDGIPGQPGTNIVWGNNSTNRLTNTTWSGIYRADEWSSGATNRPIMANTCNVSLNLPAGTYWVAWQTDGSNGLSGPWMPPVTINGSKTTGNGIQSLSNSGLWNPGYDSGTGTIQGMPFVVHGFKNAIAVDDNVVGWENVTLNIDVKNNDINADNGIVNLFAPKTTEAGGTVWVLGDKISYSPPAGFIGKDKFEYQMCSNGHPIKCSSATVYVTVNSINDLPVVDNEIISLDEDASFSGDLTDAGDFDPEGTVLLVNTTPVVAPANGTLIIGADGLYTYTPNSNFNGTDLVVVKVCDQETPVVACVPDSIIITVNGINDAPIATSVSLTIEEDMPAVVDISGNVTDVEGNGLASFVISGAATFSALYELSYVPTPNFNGTEVITYSICDDAGACDTATVTITVTPVNDPPTVISTFEDIEIQVGEKRDLVLDDLLELLFDDVDEGDALTLSVVMANGIPLPAWVTITDGVMTSLPYGGNLGCYDLLFVATDVAGATVTEPFTICVVNKNVATGIEEMGTTFGVSLYPNPSSGRVVLDVEQSRFDKSTVVVYNVTGQIILNQKFSQNKINLNLENQASGMYYVKVRTGNKETIKKLVLNRE